MKPMINFLDANYFLHWICAVLGIFSLLLIRLFRVKNFQWKIWFEENLIGLLWSLFFLSLVVTCSAQYTSGYTHLEAYFTGYCGAHVIFRLNKEPKAPSQRPFIHRKQHR
jgi:hypothetical protein